MNIKVKRKLVDIIRTSTKLRYIKLLSFNSVRRVLRPSVVVSFVHTALLL